MCDYSIEHSASTREAVVGDELVSTQFNSHSRGFSGVGKQSVAVCVKPGTELRFENNVKVYAKTYGYRSIIEDTIVLFSNILRMNRKTIKTNTAVFRQVDPFYDFMGTSALAKAYQAGKCRHRDALEFPDGQVVLLTNLVPGQKAAVLQLPIKETPKVVEEVVGDHCSNTPARELETIG